MNFNDTLPENLNFPIFTDVFHCEPPVLFASSKDINPLTSQVKQLSLDLHTQALRVEV